MRSVRVFLDVPDSMINISRWALETLLFPLGLAAEWQDRTAETTDIYYGPNPESVRARITLAYSVRAADTCTGRLDVEDAEVTWKDWEGRRWPVIFRDLPGRDDLVAGAWFFLSGWQEVTTRRRDEKGRFCFEDSMQARHNFAKLPVVDAYREWLAAELARAGINGRRRSWGSSDWAFCPTVDVDYLRKWRKGMVYREVVQYALLNRLRKSAAQRLKRLGGFVRDMFRRGDVYRESLVQIISSVQEVNGTATIFFKTGAHGSHDVYYSLDSHFVRRIMDAVQHSGFEVGLHPSYNASTHPGYMLEESERLTAITGKRIRSVRQHYLRYEQPVTPRLQEEAGFKIDSTLGFAESEGFRRGTCVPFRVFDLFADKPSSLWEMPLVIMDGTLFNRRMLSSDDAIRATSEIMDTCRRFRGCAVVLWHNVLLDALDAPGWLDHFQGTLAVAREQKAAISSLSHAFDSWSQSRGRLPAKDE